MKFYQSLQLQNMICQIMKFSGQDVGFVLNFLVFCVYLELSKIGICILYLPLELVSLIFQLSDSANHVRNQVVAFFKRFFHCIDALGAVSEYLPPCCMFPIQIKQVGIVDLNIPCKLTRESAEMGSVY